MGSSLERLMQQAGLEEPRPTVAPEGGASALERLEREAAASAAPAGPKPKRPGIIERINQWQDRVEQRDRERTEEWKDSPNPLKRVTARALDVVGDPGGEFGKGAAAGMAGQNVEDLGEFSQIIGAEGLGKRIEVGAERRAERFPARVKARKDIKSFADFIDWASYEVGRGLASTSPSLAGGAAGSAIGMATGGPPGAAIGAMVGAALPSYMQNTAQAHDELERLGVENPTKLRAVALALGIPLTALDFILPQRVVKKVTNKLMSGSAALLSGREMAQRGLVEAGEGAAIEGVTEGLQEGVEYVGTHLAAGEPIRGGELGSQMLEGAIAGAMTGGVLGGAVSVGSDVKQNADLERSGDRMAQRIARRRLDELTTRAGIAASGRADRAALRSRLGQLEAEAGIAPPPVTTGVEPEEPEGGPPESPGGLPESPGAVTEGATNPPQTRGESTTQPVPFDPSQVTPELTADDVGTSAPGYREYERMRRELQRLTPYFGEIDDVRDLPHLAGGLEAQGYVELAKWVDRLEDWAHGEGEHPGAAPEARRDEGPEEELPADIDDRIRDYDRQIAELETRINASMPKGLDANQRRAWRQERDRAQAQSNNLAAEQQKLLDKTERRDRKRFQNETPQTLEDTHRAAQILGEHTGHMRGAMPDARAEYRRLKERVQASPIWKPFAEMGLEKLAKFYEGENKAAQSGKYAAYYAKLGVPDLSYGNHELRRAEPDWMRAAQKVSESRWHAKGYRQWIEDVKAGKSLGEAWGKTPEAQLARLQERLENAESTEREASRIFEEASRAYLERLAQTPAIRESGQAPVGKSEPVGKSAEKSAPAREIKASTAQLRPLTEESPPADLVVLPCGSEKRKSRGAVPASDLYIGDYFKKALAYARTLVSDDKIRILSAQHGLVTLDQVIEPYERKFGDRGAIAPQDIVAQAVGQQIAKLENVYIVGGEEYAAHAGAVWPTGIRVIPKGLGIGQQKQLLAQLAGKTPPKNATEKAERSDDPAAQAEKRRRHLFSAPSAKGKVTTVIFDAQTKEKGRYMLVAAESLLPSHNPRREYEPEPFYPQGVQGRDYHRDQVAQRENRLRAGQMDPDIVLDPAAAPHVGPPTVDRYGRVIAGNDRTMALQMMYAAHPETAAKYQAELIRRAEEFGIKNAGDVIQIAGGKQILVRVLEDVDPDNEARLRELNRKSDQHAGKAKDAASEAATEARELLSAESALRHLADTIEPTQTLREYFGTSVGRDFARKLISDGVIRSQDAAAFFTPEGNLTDDGKRKIERMLYAAAIGDPEILNRAPPGVRNKLEGAIPSLLKVRKYPEYEIASSVAQALDILTRASAAGLDVDPFLDQLENQGGLFGGEDVDLDGEGIAIAKFIETATKTDVTKMFRVYASDAVLAAGEIDQSNMFGEIPKSREQALRDALPPELGEFFSPGELLSPVSDEGTETLGATANVPGRVKRGTKPPPPTPTKTARAKPVPQVIRSTWGPAAQPTTLGAKLRRFFRIGQAERARMHSLYSIGQAMAHALGVPVRKGRFPFKRVGALGVFKVKPETIRVLNAQQFSTVAHEIGHFVSKTHIGYGTKKTLSKEAQQELHDLGEALYGPRKPAGGYKEEGIAEFTRYYILDRARMQKDAPHFFAWWEQMLSEEPELKAVIDWATKQVDTWRSSTPAQRIASKVSVGEPARYERDATDFIARWVDDLAVLERTVDDLGGTSSILENAYSLARLTRGDLGLAEHMAKKGVIDFFTRQRVSRGLEEILQDVGRENWDEFRIWLIASRTIELHARGIDPGFDLEDAKQTLAFFGSQTRFKDFKKHAEQVYRYQHKLLAYLRDSGLMTHDEYAAILRQNYQRVPFYRKFEADERAYGGGQGKAYARNSSGVKTIRGSARDIIDPFESIVKDTYAIVSRANKHHAATRLVKLAQSREGGGFFVEQVEAPKEKRIINIRKVLQQLMDAGWRLPEKVEQLMAEFDQLARERRGGKGKPKPSAQRLKEIDDRMNDILLELEPFYSLDLEGWYLRHFANGADDAELVIPILINGERRWYQVKDKRLWQALKNMQTEEMNTWLRIMEAPNRALRAGAVLAPEFIGSNPIRDMFHTATYSRAGTRPPGWHFAIGMFHLAFGKFSAKGDKAFNRWVREGGLSAGMVGYDRASLQKALKFIGESKHGQAWRIVRHPIETLRMLAELTENANRLGEFVLVEKKALKEGKSAQEASKEAALASRDLLDFYRAGVYGRNVNRIIAFFNAHVQDLDKMTREHFTHGGKRSLSVMGRATAFITIPSILLYLWQKDDEIYQEIPSYVKDTGWVIVTRNDDGSLKRIWWIPRPHVLGFIYGRIPERILEWIGGIDERALEKLRNTFWNMVVPPVIPTIFRPLIENWANHKFFNDRPVVPRRIEGLDAPHQAARYTGETARRIGQIADYSPAKIEHLIRGFTGGLGQYGLEMTDWIVRTGREAVGSRPLAPPDPRKEDPLEDIPLVKRFAIPEPGDDAESVNDLYERFDDSESRRRTLKQYINTGDTEGARSYLQEHIDAIAEVLTAEEAAGEAGALRRFKQAMDELHEGQATVFDAPIDDEDRLRINREIERGMVTLARAFYRKGGGYYGRP